MQVTKLSLYGFFFPAVFEFMKMYKRCDDAKETLGSQEGPWVPKNHFQLREMTGNNVNFVADTSNSCAWRQA